MQDSKALEILNLVDFRYKAEIIKDTSYRKLLDTYKYMLNDNLSICYIKKYSISRYGCIELIEVDCSYKFVEISDIERDNSLFKIYKKEPIDEKWFDIHIQQISRPNYSISQIKTKKNKEFKLIVFNEIRRKGIAKGLQNERRRQTIT